MAYIFALWLRRGQLLALGHSRTVWDKSDEHSEPGDSALAGVVNGGSETLED